MIALRCILTKDIRIAGNPKSLKKFEAACAATGRTSECCTLAVVRDHHVNLGRITADLAKGGIGLLCEEP